MPLFALLDEPAILITSPALKFSKIVDAVVEFAVIVVPAKAILFDVCVTISALSTYGLFACLLTIMRY